MYKSNPYQPIPCPQPQVYVAFQPIPRRFHGISHTNLSGRSMNHAFLPIALISHFYVRNTTKTHTTPPINHYLKVVGYVMYNKRIYK